MLHQRELVKTVVLKIEFVIHDVFAHIAILGEPFRADSS